MVFFGLFLAEFECENIDVGVFKWSFGDVKFRGIKLCEKNWLICRRENNNNWEEKVRWL